MGTRSYRVVIPYTRPAPDGIAEICEDAFTVEAGSAHHAKQVAIERFRRAVDDLPVRWERQIVSGDIRVEFAGRTIAEIQAEENSFEETIGGP